MTQNNLWSDSHKQAVHETAKVTKDSIMLTVSQTADFFSQHDNYLIITHINPDGDTCGSAAALCAMLRKLGKAAYILPNETATDRYDAFYGPYLPGPKMDEYIINPGTVVTVDIADTTLLSKSAQPYAEKVDLCIDHHPSNRLYSKYLLLNSVAAATGEIILDIIREKRIELDKELALPLYLAISTDTGCFRYSNTTSRTFRDAADLIDTGIDYVDINVRFFETRSKERLLLEQKVLESIRYYDKRNTALATITQKMISETDAKEEDTENFSSLLQSIEGIEIGVLLRECRENVWKISVRTGCNANASDICKTLGGGGHARAAGCTFEGSLEDAVLAMIDAIEAEQIHA